MAGLTKEAGLFPAQERSSQAARMERVRLPKEGPYEKGSRTSRSGAGRRFYRHCRLFPTCVGAEQPAELKGDRSRQYRGELQGVERDERGHWRRADDGQGHLERQ